MNKFIEYFNEISPLSKDEIQTLEESMETIKISKGSYLLREKQVPRENYFVLSGCVRQYSFIHGNERTTNIFTENQWIVPLSDTLDSETSDYYLVCEEDSELVIGSEEMAQDLYTKHPRFLSLAHIVFERVYIEQQNLVALFRLDTPEGRYLKLLKTRPDILQRLPQYHIASYIGVQPESLSRIRKRISEKLALNR